VTRHTIKKWQTRDKSTDKSHRPDHLQTTLTPIQKLKEWYKKKPELFKKNIYDLAGLE